MKILAHRADVFCFISNSVGSYFFGPLVVLAYVMLCFRCVATVFLFDFIFESSRLRCFCGQSNCDVP